MKEQNYLEGDLMKHSCNLNALMTVILAALTFSTLAHADITTPSAMVKKMTKPPMKKEKPKTEEPATVATPPTTPAAPITYQINTMAGEEKFEDTPLAKSRSLVAGDKTIELKSVNVGLRKKAVFGLVPVRVYVAQFFAAAPEKLTKTEDGILNSLKAAGPVQLRLTFLRDLPGTKIADSFKEGLESNKINVKNLSPELTQVMNIISAISEFKKTDSFSITATWTDTSSTLLLESSTEIKVITGSAELATEIMSIWFGKPADGKLGDLKKSLIK